MRGKFRTKPPLFPILAALIKLLHLPFHSERRNGEYGCVGGSFRREALQDADVDAERVREFVPHGVDVQRDACGGGNGGRSLSQ